MYAKVRQWVQSQNANNWDKLVNIKKLATVFTVKIRAKISWKYGHNIIDSLKKSLEYHAQFFFFYNKT